MIPAVQGLLPEPHNGKLMTLLFRLAEWHALAKLRMHTEHTLNALNQSTVAIGRELRSFQAWTQGFKTFELPKEKDARQRRTRKKAASKTALAQAGPTLFDPPTGAQSLSAEEISQQRLKDKPTISKKGTVSSGLEPTDPSISLAEQYNDDGPIAKYFNLLTYKLHALGDYVQTVRLFGTTDSYSTQIVRSTVFIRYLLTCYYHRVNLRTVRSNASISGPTRKMPPDK